MGRFDKVPTTVAPFRYFSQKVLPTVYDDSLSYLELLNKMEKYLNDVIETVNENTDNFNELLAAYNTFVETVNQALQGYENFLTDYFDNLDLQQEVNEAIDEMITSGVFDEIISPFVSAQVPLAVNEWLDEHPEATTTVEDGSITEAKLANSLLDVLAKRDGYYPHLAAGLADNIPSGTIDTSTYIVKETGAKVAGVARVEAIYGNTIVEDDQLLSVDIGGFESVGFNQWDEEWELGGITNNTGVDAPSNDTIRSKSYIPVISGESYYFKSSANLALRYYDDSKAFLGVYDADSKGDIVTTGADTNRIRRIPSNCAYVRFATWNTYGTTYKHDICINISDPARNGTYEPYMHDELAIYIATLFPSGLKSAGSAHDELTCDTAITRVGAVDLGTLSWVYNTTFNCFAANPGNAHIAPQMICAPYAYVGSYNALADKTCAYIYNYNFAIRDSAYSDAVAFKAAMSGVLMFYELATPTTTPIDPPLNMSYHVEPGGTESLLHEGSTAPAIVETCYPFDVLNAGGGLVANVEYGKASTNYAIGSYFIYDGILYRATSAIAAGETINPGTNCIATTVMAELISLTS